MSNLISSDLEQESLFIQSILEGQDSATLRAISALSCIKNALAGTNEHNSRDALCVLESCLVKAMDERGKILRSVKKIEAMQSKLIQSKLEGGEAGRKR